MRILDRYILRQFLINFAILLVVLLALFLVVDMIAGMDEFLPAGRRWADQYGGVLPATVVVLVDYYGPMLLMLYAFCSGMPVVGAMGFTLVGLQRSREAVGMVAGGVSLYRVAAPILVMGALLNAAVLPLQEFAIPPLAEKLMRPKSQLKHTDVTGKPIRLVPDGSGDLLSATSFDPSTGTLQDVTIHVRDKKGLARRRITATEAVWMPKRQGWQLINGYADTVQDWREALQDSTRAGVGPESVDFFSTGLSPDVLVATRQSELYPWFLSMPELWRMQSNEAVEADQQLVIQRIIWGRLSLLVLNVLVLVLGLAFFLQLGQRNVFVQGILALLVCGSVWGGGLGLLMAGMVGLNPVATAWLPVVVALPLSAALLQLVRT